MAGAGVTLTNLGTQERRQVQSGADGSYQFLNLIPGSYRVTVAPPFTPVSTCEPLMSASRPVPGMTSRGWK